MKVTPVARAAFYDCVSSDYRKNKHDIDLGKARRKCLGLDCGKHFESPSKGERFCYACSYINSKMSSTVEGVLA